MTIRRYLHLMEVGSFLDTPDVFPLVLGGDVAAALVFDAVRKAPPFRPPMDVTLAVNFCGLTGKASTKYRRANDVDRWYNELECRDIGGLGGPYPGPSTSQRESRSTSLQRSVMRSSIQTNRTAQRFSQGCAGKRSIAAGVQKKWGLPDASTMSARLARYPAPDVENLGGTIVMAAAAFTCELERGHDPGSDSDRASVAVLAAGHLVRGNHRAPWGVRNNKVRTGELT